MNERYLTVQQPGVFDFLTLILQDSQNTMLSMLCTRPHTCNSPQTRTEVDAAVCGDLEPEYWSQATAVVQQTLTFFPGRER